MADLPARPDLDQLRHQARELLRAAQRNNPEATARIRAVSEQIILSSAQLALAREYGFASWAKLKLEVERRDVLNSRDLSRLTSLLAEHPELATAKMEHWCDHQLGADPLGYMAMLRFDHGRLGLPRELPGTGAMARALIDAGAPVNGCPGDTETPLITAASCGDAEVAQVLIAAGPPASGGCSPTAPTPTSATPRTTAPRWRRPRTVTAPDTARSKPSSGPSPRTPRHPPSPLAPEPRHPNPPRNSHHPRVRPQEPFRNRELSGLPV
jgi:hypothetical protein